MRIAENLLEVQKRIQEAAARSGRDSTAVTLVAVSKTVGVEAIEEAQVLGLTHFGENRVQELKWKRERFPQAHWHMIGRLQTNKVKDAVGQAALIHSLDRWSLAEALDKRGRLLGVEVPTLLQVSLAGEEQKAGVLAGDVEAFLESVGQLKWLRIKGLMTMAPLSEDSEKSRPFFKELCEIYRCYNRRTYQNVEMKHLSMGMSQDFEIAIEEGATMIRVGTALFGE
ncbi:MAG: YggS family pyridoxal phosphate-dependent enzyme [Syntrophomonadaceae bacterium]